MNPSNDLTNAPDNIVWHYINGCLCAGLRVLYVSFDPAAAMRMRNAFGWHPQSHGLTVIGTRKELETKLVGHNICHRAVFDQSGDQTTTEAEVAAVKRRIENALPWHESGCGLPQILHIECATIEKAVEYIE